MSFHMHSRNYMTEIPGWPLPQKVLVYRCHFYLQGLLMGISSNLTIFLGFLAWSFITVWHGISFFLFSLLFHTPCPLAFFSLLPVLCLPMLPAPASPFLTRKDMKGWMPGTNDKEALRRTGPSVGWAFCLPPSSVTLPYFILSLGQQTVFLFSF